MVTSPKRTLLFHFARVGKALGHPTRLELLDLLAQGEMTVERLAEQARIPIKNTSAHLRTLRQAALVTTRREGTWVYYRLADPAVHRLLMAVQDVARRQLAEVREVVRDYFADPDGFEPVALDELAGRLGDGSVTLLDVRPEDEYAQGHIPGALSVPLSQLESRLDLLPHGGEIVAYCRGPYCVLAVEATELLRRRGFRVRRLADGMPAWAARGLPMVAGSAPGGLA
jgi:rhodanese-related sulfurtransferase/DNA-binding transcriptional ArsR family regulator